MQPVQNTQEHGSKSGIKPVFCALKIANERGKTITENILATWFKANILWHM